MISRGDPRIPWRPHRLEATVEHGSALLTLYHTVLKTAKNGTMTPRSRHSLVAGNPTLTDTAAGRLLTYPYSLNLVTL